MVHWRSCSAQLFSWCIGNNNARDDGKDDNDSDATTKGALERRTRVCSVSFTSSRVVYLNQFLTGVPRGFVFRVSLPNSEIEVIWCCIIQPFHVVLVAHVHMGFKSESKRHARFPHGNSSTIRWLWDNGPNVSLLHTWLEAWGPFVPPFSPSPKHDLKDRRSPAQLIRPVLRRRRSWLPDSLSATFIRKKIPDVFSLVWNKGVEVNTFSTWINLVRRTQPCRRCNTWFNSNPQTCNHEYKIWSGKARNVYSSHPSKIYRARHGANSLYFFIQPRGKTVATRMNTHLLESIDNGVHFVSPVQRSLLHTTRAFNVVRASCPVHSAKQLFWTYFSRLLLQISGHLAKFGRKWTCLLSQRHRRPSRRPNPLWSPASRRPCWKPHCCDVRQFLDSSHQRVQ